MAGTTGQLYIPFQPLGTQIKKARNEQRYLRHCSIPLVLLSPFFFQMTAETVTRWDRNGLGKECSRVTEREGTQLIFLLPSR